MKNTPMLAFTLPAFLFAAGCAVTEPATNDSVPAPQHADNPSTSTVQQSVTLCELLTTLGGGPCPSSAAAVSLASHAPASLTYATSGWSTCTMTFTVLATGFSDSFPFPTDDSATVGAGSGVRYTLSCTQAAAAITLFSGSASTLVF